MHAGSSEDTQVYDGDAAAKAFVSHPAGVEVPAELNDGVSRAPEVEAKIPENVQPAARPRLERAEPLKEPHFAEASMASGPPASLPAEMPRNLKQPRPEPIQVDGATPPAGKKARLEAEPKPGMDLDDFPEEAQANMVYASILIHTSVAEL